MAFKTKLSPCAVCICFHVLFSNSLFLCILFISINAKEMCRPAETLGLKWKPGIKTRKHTHARAGNKREKRGKGESALSHLWICHFATTVSITFDKARNKMCVGMIVFMCTGYAWLWVCTCSVCALTYSDQISIIVCSRCYRVWDHACFLLPGFPPVHPPPSHDLLLWSKLIKDDAIMASHIHISSTNATQNLTFAYILSPNRTILCNYISLHSYIKIAT